MNRLTPKEFESFVSVKKFMKVGSLSQQLRAGKHPQFEFIVAPTQRHLSTLGPMRRLLTGDVPVSAIKKLGRWDRDAFACSAREWEKKGIYFQRPERGAATQTDLGLITGDQGLALADGDRFKVACQGAWILEFSPDKVAMPTQRRSQWNPHFVEGGMTKGGMAECVVSNTSLEDLTQCRLYRVEPDGRTTEYKMLDGEWVPYDQYQRCMEFALKGKQGLKEAIAAGDLLAVRHLVNRLRIKIVPSDAIDAFAAGHLEIGQFLIEASKEPPPIAVGTTKEQHADLEFRKIKDLVEALKV